MQARSHLDLEQTFRALRHRNYRLWFYGQMLSLVGTWTQTTAQAYLVFELTRSTAYLGYVGFASGASSWLLMLYGGVVADRLSRRNLLLGAQSFMMALAFVLAGLSFAGRVQPWHIVLLAFWGGVANAFDAPARQAFVLELVQREDLGNAIALNSMMFNVATAVGPAIAGVVYARFGPAWCFTVNGVSFLAVIVALLWMRIEPRPPSEHGTSSAQALVEGLRYTAGHRTIRSLIGVVAVTTLVGMAYVTLIPDWAVTVLGGDSRTNGWLQSTRGAGALLAALMIAARAGLGSRGRMLSVGSVAYPAMLLVFAASRSLPLALLAILGVGWGLMIVYNLANTLVQTHVSDELRGRVMSLYTLTFFGLMPLSALVAGAVAAHIGSPATVALSASISLGVAVFLWLRRSELRELI
jgi:predicted MFS family arabinose efflux permease